MENTTEVGSSAPVPAGSAEGNPEGDSPVKSVKFEDHKRALDDMKKEKLKAKELERKLQELETKKLEEEGQWKILAERKKELRVAAEQKAEGLRNDLYISKKFEEVAREAQKAGMRSEALSDLELLPLDGVEVERTSHGRMLIHGADSFVQDLKRKRPHWFAQPSTPKVNSGGTTAAGVESSRVTPQMIFDAEKKGDKEKVRELTNLYMQQKSSK